ncbi:hypothetical protein BD324DRAFT_609533 [Kockovaella imperatae]|uniref:C2H2-type domain-containing protein n=1 Tax=Kockovaella imperatae TaxID=4999 RepID=A0A1Y1UCL4_9TREE|nr:hypothetical protein BD324DRAFT_609533 [Kockovaella imperatae]ORX35267.1 hypothetical protein BD324DRAFT_609533 [Kockovaella imperatae]
MSTYSQDRPPLGGSGYDNNSTPHYSRSAPSSGPSGTPTGPSPDRYAQVTSVATPAHGKARPVPQSPFPSTGESTSSYAQPHPQPPITPLSASHYPSQPPPSSGSGSFFGVAQTPTDQAIPSPPPTTTSRPGSSNANFTPDGVPIVPVGVSGGKMFRCRGYGECDKVFTRSEHLARHVRKHTGERPFPCHCGKAFSRLDNLRQHAATVHADQTPLNDAMLSSLAPVHAALSQRANREQRKRGEVVEVPKGAVERRHSEVSRKGSPVAGQVHVPAAYDAYGQTGPVGPDWHVPLPQASRPRTGGAFDYYQSAPDDAPSQGAAPHGDDAGPSRRPMSSASSYAGYPSVYYDNSNMRPPTSTATTPQPNAHELSQLPYPYRPMSSNGRDLPVPAHYAGSEPPQSAHSTLSTHPPPSPMYAPPHATPAAAAPSSHWSSPSSHTAYPGSEPYHAHPGASHEAYAYPPPPAQEAAGSHGPPYGAPPPPPSGAYGYSNQATYYPPQQYGSLPPPPPQFGTPGSYPPPPPGYPHPHPHSLPPPSSLAHPTPPAPAAHHHQASLHTPGAPPPDSPFAYQPSPQQFSYGQGGFYDAARKRRMDEEASSARKYPRMDSSHTGVSSANESLNVAFSSDKDQDSLWLPPVTERRSSLAISALLGSPQQVPRSRPGTADLNVSSHFDTYKFPSDSKTSGPSVPSTPLINARPAIKEEVKQEPIATAGAA